MATASREQRGQRGPADQWGPPRTLRTPRAAGLGRPGGAGAAGGGQAAGGEEPGKEKITTHTRTHTYIYIRKKTHKQEFSDGAGWLGSAAPASGATGRGKGDPRAAPLMARGGHWKYGWRGAGKDLSEMLRGVCLLTAWPLQAASRGAGDPVPLPLPGRFCSWGQDRHDTPSRELQREPRPGDVCGDSTCPGTGVPQLPPCPPRCPRSLCRALLSQ